jgi:hypothetical protein
VKNEKTKNIVILILSIIVIILLIFNLFQPNTMKSSNIVLEVMGLQSKVSEYIGKMKSDTFDIYTKEQLLSGMQDSEKIKDNNGDDCLQLIDINNKIVKQDINYYKVNKDNIFKEFKIQLDEELEYYISSNSDVRVKYSIKPLWWVDELNSLVIN